MVIYFSGTGNSRAVALKIADALGLTVHELTGELLISAGRSATLRAEGKAVIWVFPVYSWGIPPVVVDFIKNCTIDGGDAVVHHLVVTCGDDAGMTASQWRKLMASRGWKTGSATSVIMPNTYVLMKGFDTDSQAIATRKLNKAPAVVSETVNRINSGMTDDLVIRGRFPRVKSYVIYPWFKRYAMSPKPFRSLDSCISCGRCAHSCPMENIDISEGRPKWGSRCALCLRCYHICPVHAVAYGKATDGKGQYLYPSR